MRRTAGNRRELPRHKSAGQHRYLGQLAGHAEGPKRPPEPCAGVRITPRALLSPLIRAYFLVEVVVDADPSRDRQALRAAATVGSLRSRPLSMPPRGALGVAVVPGAGQGDAVVAHAPAKGRPDAGVDAATPEPAGRAEVPARPPGGGERRRVGPVGGSGGWCAGTGGCGGGTGGTGSAWGHAVLLEAL